MVTTNFLNFSSVKKGAEAPFHPNNLLVPNRTAYALASAFV
ncbi:MAG: hypothetical protein RLZZ314_182 [Bacteroidota bacterium]|jgi:hypothetical protein